MNKDCHHSKLHNLFRFARGVVLAGIGAISAVLFSAVPGRCADTALPDPALMSAHFLDIPYASESPVQKLDIYLPKQGEKPYPVVLRVHGDDRKTAGRRSRIADYADPVLKRGYALVSIDYRYSSEAIFTARIYDVKAAVRHIKAVSEDHDLDPHRIIAWGESTGATLAALLAVSSDVAALEDLGLGNPDQSSRIHGAIVWYGVFDFQRNDGQPATSSGTDAVASKLPGDLTASTPELAAFMSPTSYITMDDPPFLIQHGAKDTRVPVQQSVRFATELEEVLGGEMVFLHVLENAAHADPAFFSPGNMEKVLMFLDTWTD
jgi:acetyl esterase/lipase